MWPSWRSCITEGRPLKVIPGPRSFLALCFCLCEMNRLILQRLWIPCSQPPWTNLFRIMNKKKSCFLQIVLSGGFLVTVLRKITGGDALSTQQKGLSPCTNSWRPGFSASRGQSHSVLSKMTVSGVLLQEHTVAKILTNLALELNMCSSASRSNLCPPLTCALHTVHTSAYFQCMGQ